MEYKIDKGVQGAWIKKDANLNGKIAKLVSEVKSEASKWKDDNGNVKTQDVGKLQIENEESANFAINKPTLKALISAFGSDSKAWINQPLTIKAMDTVVSGKAGVAMFLIPEGFEYGKDGAGYICIDRKFDSAPNNPQEETLDYPEGQEEVDAF